jgi:LDH2 family malate/lactate/ureidoglycolate dehydrogenase
VLTRERDAVVDTHAQGSGAGSRTVAIASVSDWAVEVLTSLGLSAGDAAVTVEALAFAEARGVRTHGFVRLETYAARIRAGGIDPKAQPKIEADLGAMVYVDANHGMGMSSGVFCADLAVERATEHGVGLAIARNASHFGAAAFFTNRIADRDMLGFAFCNTDKVMCAPFGGKAVLGTNPIAMAVPLPYQERPQLDMATTHVAAGRLVVAAQDGKPIPPDWAVDRDGRPTTSPSAGLEGALFPSGGPKGFGLAFAVDALVALSGAETSPHVGRLYGDPSVPQRLGQAFLAVRPRTSLKEYRRSMSDLVDAIHGSGSAVGPAPLAPGEPELARELSGDGAFELTDGLMKTLVGVGDEAQCPFPTSLAR